ncbi:MAG: hypothetical protein VW521_07330 [Rhodospirillales bacterium]
MHRTFGTWLSDYEGHDPIGWLSYDFVVDCRRKKILPSSIKTGSEMEKLMYRSAMEYGCAPCSDAFEALERACILYGDPWRMESHEEDAGTTIPWFTGEGYDATR